MYHNIETSNIFLTVSILLKPILARRKSSETVTLFGIDEDGLSTHQIIGIGASMEDDSVLEVASGSEKSKGLIDENLLASKLSCER